MPDDNEPKVRFATEASPQFGKLGGMNKRVSEQPVVSPQRFVPKIKLETLDSNEDKDPMNKILRETFGDKKLSAN